MLFSVAQGYLDDSFQIRREEPNSCSAHCDFFPLWHSVMHRNNAGRRFEVIILRTTIDAKL